MSTALHEKSRSEGVQAVGWQLYRSIRQLRVCDATAQHSCTYLRRSCNTTAEADHFDFQFNLHSSGGGQKALSTTRPQLARSLAS